MKKRILVVESVLSVKVEQDIHESFKMLCKNNGIKKADMVRVFLKKVLDDVEFFGSIKSELV